VERDNPQPSTPGIIAIVKTRFLALTLMLLPAIILAAEQESKPLPDKDAFLSEVKKNLRSDRLLLSQYTFNESSHLIVYGKKGKVRKEETKVFEVFPSVDEKLTYRRLIEKDGKPVDQKKLDKEDRKQAKKAKKHSSEKEQRKREKELQKEKAVIDEMSRLYEFELEGREEIEGHSTIVVSFVPRAGFKTKIKEVKQLKKVRGRAWISEIDHQVVKVEGELIDGISFGWGMVAKLKKGARMTFHRQRVNDEIWLPAEAYFTGAGKVLLFVGFNVEFSSQYSNYRKYTVESSISYETQTQR